MNREALKLKNIERKLWKKYCRTNNELDFLNFKNCRDKVRSTTRDLRVQYEVDLTNNIKTRTIIPTLTLNDGSTAKTSLDKAEALNNYFGSVQTDEDCTNVPLCEVKYSGIPLSKIIFARYGKDEAIKPKWKQIYGS